MSKKAVAYYRTSSAANVGVDKERQPPAGGLEARESGGLRAGREFYDAAVTGADPIACASRLRRHARSHRGQWRADVLVETASRFARDILVQERAGGS